MIDLTKFERRIAPNEEILNTDIIHGATFRLLKQDGFGVKFIFFAGPDEYQIHTNHKKIALDFYNDMLKAAREMPEGLSSTGILERIAQNVKNLEEEFRVDVTPMKGFFELKEVAPSLNPDAHTEDPGENDREYIHEATNIRIHMGSDFETKFHDSKRRTRMKLDGTVLPLEDIYEVYIDDQGVVFRGTKAEANVKYEECMRKVVSLAIECDNDREQTMSRLKKEFPKI